MRVCISTVVGRRSFLQVGALALAGGLSGSLRAAEPGTQAPRFLLEWGKMGTEPGEFHFPIGLAVNPADEVFVTDFYNARVQKFSPGGKFLASFPVPPNPGAVALDAAGDLYITHFSAMRAMEERKPDRVTVHTAAGKFLREWGKTGTADGEFDYPGGLAIDRQGRVYVADQTNHRVQVFDRRGRFLLKWGEYGSEAG
jgi:DNA-binding beta-propeller fold protein YncE